MPKIVQRLFLAFVIIVVGYIVGVNAGFIKPHPAVERVTNQINTLLTHNVAGTGEEVRSTTGSISNQLNVLAKRGSDVNSHTQQVLGQYVQSVEESETNPDKDAQPLHEQAFEYGRYVYCQQVVKDFEGTGE